MSGAIPNSQFDKEYSITWQRVCFGKKFSKRHWQNVRLVLLCLSVFFFALFLLDVWTILNKASTIDNNVFDWLAFVQVLCIGFKLNSFVHNMNMYIVVHSPTMNRQRRGARWVERETRVPHVFVSYLEFSFSYLSNTRIEKKVTSVDKLMFLRSNEMEFCKKSIYIHRIPPTSPKCCHRVRL